MEETLEKVENMFLRYGFKSVTMDHIARELGISKKTLYQFVDNKYDLILKVCQSHIDCEKAIIVSLRATATNAISEMLEISKNINKSLKKVNSNLVFDLQKYYPKAWDLFESYRLEHIYAVIKENIERGMKEGVYRKEIEPTVIAKVYIGVMHLLFDDTYFSTEEYNPSKVYLEMIHYHINGIASPKGLEMLDSYYKEEQKGK